MSIRPGAVLLLVLSWGVGCTYVGTQAVDGRMIDQLVEASDRLEIGMTRDEAMAEFPAGEKLDWGRGVAEADESVKYEEWRVYAADNYDRQEQRWDRPPRAEEFRVFQRWLYFRDGELYAVEIERRPFEKQEGVRLTWRRNARYDPFGEAVSGTRPESPAGTTTSDGTDGSAR